MNSGGEPERDDTGLPPVDIEIPDDARELDRDVQAYYREQRAERRRLRHHRLHSRIARDGIVLPLVACCLILALITGTLLTVFTATSDQVPAKGTGRPPASHRPVSSSPSSRGPASRGSASSGAASSGAASRAPSKPPASSPAPALNPRVQTGAPLPAGTLVLEVTGVPVPLRTMTLHETMLVLVPSACRCGTTVSWLAGIAARDTVTTFLVGTPQTIGEVKDFHSRLPVSLQPAAPVALDSQGVLARAYPVRGLTVVLVPRHPTGTQSAEYAQNLSAADNSAPLLRALAG